MKAILEDVVCVALGVALFFGLPWLYTLAGLNSQYDASLEASAQYAGEVAE